MKKNNKIPQKKGFIWETPSFHFAPQHPLFQTNTDFNFSFWPQKVVYQEKMRIFAEHKPKNYKYKPNKNQCHENINLFQQKNTRLTPLM